MNTLHRLSDAQSWLRGLGATGLSTDSRKIQSGDVFIAWPGAAVDGRQFVASAYQAGAVGAIVDARMDTQADAKTNSEAPSKDTLNTPNTVAFEGLKAASGEIASLFYNTPSQQLNIVAFTGTNGKTTSSWWLVQALSNLPDNAQKNCAVVGTLGTGMIGAIENNGLTTPDPVLMQARLKDFVDAGCKVVALEASSIGIAEGRLNGTQIHTAVFTNFTQDHLDYHGSMTTYWQAKAALFDWPRLKAAVINIDDPQGMVLLDHLQTQQTYGASLDVWTTSINKAARLQATHITTTPQGLTFNLIADGQTYPLQTSLIGRYNVSNLLGVMAAMRSLGIPLAACLLACEQVSPVSGRLEIISPAPSASVAHVSPMVVVDYAHTPDALQKVLIALRELATSRSGKLWCVFGCGGNRDGSKRPVMGATARSYADHIVITSDNPRDESASTIIAQILLGLEEDASVQVQADRAKAIAETVAQASARDVIVIAGKGHEDYQEIAGVKYPFSDQSHAKAALAAWRATP